MRRWALGLAAAAAAAVVVVVVAGGDGDGDGEPATGPEPELPAPAAPPGPAPAGEPSDDQAQEPAQSGPSARRRARRQATRAYRDYLRAIDRRDGAALCDLLAPGFRSALEPPRRRDGCAATMRASIGFEDPRGFPVWEGTELSSIDGVKLLGEGAEARVTATIVTAFADRAEPSVESDIAYLERVPQGWRLVKASGALWRALGKPDVPPSVLSPP